jgi:outer membrane protein assembly factor BamB
LGNRGILKIFFSLLILNLVACSSLKNMQESISKLDAPKRDVSAFHMAWNKNLDPTHNSGNLPIGTSSPFIYQDLLFMGDLSGMMRAYDIENGKVIWEMQETEALNAKASNYKDQIIYGSISGRLYSRHFLTGKLKYAIDLGAPIESEPVLSDGRLYIHLRNHKIMSLDAETGKIIWGYKRSVPFVTTLHRSSKVLPLGDKLIVGFADGNIVALSKPEGIVVWEQKISDGVKFVDVDAAPLYFNDYIIAGSANDKLRFIDPSNGIIKRTINLVIGHQPLVFQDDLIVGTIYGEIYRIDGEGKIIAKTKLSNNGISSIAKWRDGFVVATMGSDLFFVNQASFKSVENFKLGHDQSAIFGFLQQKSDYLATYSSRNRLYVFKNIK